MNSASVGWQCPECISAAAASAPVITASQMLRGSVPIVTYVLIGINVAAYVVGAVMGGVLSVTGAGDGLTERFALYPPLVTGGEWYRLITGGFLHAGIVHIGFNMFALYVIGTALEPAIGRARFLAAYAVSLVGGALGVMLLWSASEGYTVGASGAIFGLFGILAVLQFARGINPLRSGIGTVLIINLVITFAVPGISKGGHIGGLVIGALAGAILFLGRDLSRQSPGERAARLGAVVALTVVVFWAAVAAAPSVSSLIGG